MATENKTVKEKLATVTEARANAKSPMTFMTSAVDASSGASVGGLASHYSDQLNIYAIQTYINQDTGAVTLADNKFGNITATSVTADSSTVGDFTATGTINDGTPRNGFCGVMSSVNENARFTFDNDTRVATFSFADARDADFYSDGVRCVIPDGDPGLTAAPISGTANGWYTYYFDSDCQLKAVLDPDLALFSTKCLVASLYYSPSNTGIPAGTHSGADIGTFRQWHGAESIDWRSVHHNTENSKIGCCNDFEVTTTSTPSVPTSVINVSAGTIWDEDLGTAYDAIDGTTDVWATFYYEGIESGNLIVKRGPKTLSNLSHPFVLATDAGVVGATAGNIIYNNITYDVNGDPNGATVGEVTEGKYVLVHVFIVSGPTINNIAITGQNLHDSIEEAREAVSIEINNITNGTEIVTEGVHVATLILDNTGNIIPVNNDGLMVADVRERENKIVFGSSNEVVVPNGAGYIKSTRSVSLGSVTTENSTVMQHLSGNSNEFTIVGPGGVIGSFDLLGAGDPGGSETTTSTLVSDYNYTGGNPAQYDTVLSVTVPSSYTLGTFTYSLDMNLTNATGGLYVKVRINSVDYNETLFTGTYGSGINISKTVANGALSANDVVDIQIKTANNSKTATVLAGSTLSVVGQLPGATPYFVLQENGSGLGTHTFQNLVVTGDITVNGNVNFPNLPTSDPGVPGQLYRSGGTLLVSI